MASFSKDSTEKEEVDGRSPESLTAEARSQIKIFVADDERTLRETCRSFLETQGYTVEVASRGKDAAKILRSSDFDIILLDLYMTEVSGLELLKICLRKSPDTIAIIATGNPSIESSVEALREGAWDYLAKPFSAHHVHIMISSATVSI